MAISDSRQLLLLLWKNWLHKKRAIVSTIITFLCLPVLSLLFMLQAGTSAFPTFHANKTVWDSFPADTTLPPNQLIPPRNSSSASYDPRWRLVYGPDSSLITSIVNNTVQMLAGKNLAFQRMTLGRGYHYDGFLAIQRATDIGIMQALGVNQLPVELELKSFPLNDSALYFLSNRLPCLIVLCCFCLALAIPDEVVLEKEQGQKEFMKLMGMKVWLYWLMYFIQFFIYVLIIACVMTVLFHSNYVGKKIINYTDPSVTFVFLLLYTTSVIMFSFAISAIFPIACLASRVSGFLLVLLYLPMLHIGSSTTYPTLSAGTKAGCSIVSNLAMGIGFHIIAAFESTGVGIQWSNINKPFAVDDQFTMLHTFLMLILDIILYGLLTWYFDALLPGFFGTPQPFYFPFTKWYWCGRNSNAEMDADDRTHQGEYIETPLPGAKVGIRIRRLTKRYKSTGRLAVNNLSIDMYEGQTTALLGSEGAGKTTTLFMLTGFLPVTSGTAFINGLDLSTDLWKIRQNLGVCPQHDKLFETMTVEEHLTFFAHLKGSPRKEVPDEVNRMIQALHLQDERKTASKKLRGGMKQKLSVGIALIAGSKFVILDEPTSGMDSAARRQTWDVLESQKAGRTIILATHSLDEADLLGDRIAIMAEGQLQGYGSSSFLRDKCAIRYHVTLTVVENWNHELDRTVQRIKQHVPEAVLMSNVGAKLTFILPTESSHQFGDMFIDLEENGRELGIDRFWASVTTLEKVFLNVDKMKDSSLENKLHNGLASNSQRSLQKSSSYSHAKNSTNRHAANGSGHVTSGNDNEPFGAGFRRVHGLQFLLQQFRALLVKHIIHTVRNTAVTVVQILLPVTFTIVACVIEKYAFESQTVEPPLSLNLSHYNSPVVSYTSYGSDTTYHKPLMDAYVKVSAQFGRPGGVLLKNATDKNMDDFLTEMARANFLDEYNSNYLVAGTVFATGSPSANGSSTTLIGHFNNKALHSIGISLSMIDNTVLQTAVADGTTRIETIHHPLPPPLHSQTSSQVTRASTVGFTFSCLVSFGMTFLVATFVEFVVHERAVNAKHAQFVAGVKATSFWLSAYLWDTICFLIPSILIIIIVLAFQTNSYSTGDVVGVLFFDLALYGWAMIPFAYLFSFLFNDVSTAIGWIASINIITGAVAVCTMHILNIPSLETVEIGNALEWVFYLLLPTYCFNRGLQDLYTNHQYQKACSELDHALPFSMTRYQYCELVMTVNATNPCCPDACGFQCAKVNSNYMGWWSPGVGRSLVFMAIHGAIFSMILVCLESNIAQLVKQKLTARGSSNPMQNAVARRDGQNQNVELSQYGTSLAEDDDVKAERQRVNGTSQSELSKTHIVIFRELTKFYNGTFLAVDRLSLAIPSGECFGLLGVHGAGKTTTIKMLTGDETISAGEAWLHGFNVRKSILQIRERVGYCPQYNALIDQMTVRETLWMYARIKGVHESDMNNLVERLVAQLTLKPHANEQAINLSVRNRRKLSIGVALIGNPSIIFLDEPTTGLDPVARRDVWRTVTAIRNSGRTLVLTSNSMEECEALCTHIAIMVNGRFQCLGSTQHLKAKFGGGYSLEIKVNPGSTPADNVEDSSSISRNSPRSSSSISLSSVSQGQNVSSANGGHDDRRATELDVRMRLVMKFVRRKFPGSQLNERRDGSLRYRIWPSNKSNLTADMKEISLAYVFGEIERAKERLHIKDYSVSQTNLEQFFVSFARMQRPPQRVKAKKFCDCG